MSTSYKGYTIFGIYLGENEPRDFLAIHGYEFSDEDWENAGVSITKDMTELNSFNFFSASLGGYTSYFGVVCENDEEGKSIFEKVFPNVKDAYYQKIVEIL